MTKQDKTEKTPITVPLISPRDQKILDAGERFRMAARRLTDAQAAEGHARKTYEQTIAATRDAVKEEKDARETLLAAFS
jgi:hypothetical protein